MEQIYRIDGFIKQHYNITKFKLLGLIGQPRLNIQIILRAFMPLLYQSLIGWSVIV